MVQVVLSRTIRWAVTWGSVVALTPGVHAAEPTTAELQEQMKRLSERVQKLEQRNAELEQALSTDNMRESEPELATRLKAVEFQALGMQKQARTIEALEGITAGLGFTTVAQRESGAATVRGDGGSQLNYRADVAVSLPGGDIGSAKGKLFGQFRIGQGKGLGDALTTFSGPNTTAFQLGGVSEPSDSAVMLAQAWYQLDVPLPLGGFAPQSREHLEINFGKMDPFVFFDQNNAANDETRQFLASMFVHNALLDNPIAANVGADAYGFTPGLRLAYHNEQARPESYRLSLGVFGAGPGANFGRSFSSPFAIGQIETRKHLFSGLEGNYRLYFWRNGQAPSYAGGTQRHSGFGISLDQRVGDATTLFGRFGKARGEGLPFDQTLSAGAELGGSYWARGADALGVALGINRVSADFHRDSVTVDADADGIPDFGYVASGAEKVAELYYRYRLNRQFELTPDFQLIEQPGGNDAVPDVKIFGVRAQLTF